MQDSVIPPPPPSFLSATKMIQSSITARVTMFCLGVPSKQTIIDAVHTGIPLSQPSGCIPRKWQTPLCKWLIGDFLVRPLLPATLSEVDSITIQGWRDMDTVSPLCRVAIAHGEKHLLFFSFFGFIHPKIRGR